MPRPVRPVSVFHVRRSPLFCACVLTSLFGFLSIPLYFVFGPSSSRLSKPSPSRPPRNLTASSFSRAFLSTLPSIFDVRYESTYSVPPAFLSVLESAAQTAPVNPRTGQKRLIFTVFDSSHISFAQNLYCSSMAVGIDPNLHRFIALDKAAQREMVGLNPHVLLLDVAKRNFGYEQFCKFKLVLQYHFLLLNVETIICDDDLVFLRHPLPLFLDTCHFQVASEGADRRFTPTFDHMQFNVGFLRVVPCELTISLYNRWLRTAIPDSQRLDQAVIAQMISPFRMSTQEGPVQTYDMKEVIGRAEILRVAWFDPLSVVNGLVYYIEPFVTKMVAQERQIKQPYVVHLAWIQAAEKRSVLVAKDLWFVNDGKCIPNKPIPMEWE
jgi:hypothetical protein